MIIKLTINEARELSSEPKHDIDAKRDSTPDSIEIHAPSLQVFGNRLRNVIAGNDISRLPYNDWVSICGALGATHFETRSSQNKTIAYARDSKLIGEFYATGEHAGVVFGLGYAPLKENNK